MNTVRYRVYFFFISQHRLTFLVFLFCSHHVSQPTQSPSLSPSKSPSKEPSASPSKSPSASPSASPTKEVSLFVILNISCGQLLKKGYRIHFQSHTLTSTLSYPLSSSHSPRHLQVHLHRIAQARSRLFLHLILLLLSQSNRRSILPRHLVAALRNLPLCHLA